MMMMKSGWALLGRTPSEKQASQQGQEEIPLSTPPKEASQPPLRLAGDPLEKASQRSVRWTLTPSPKTTFTAVAKFQPTKCKNM